jgi:osmotically-inducible protein OsmY
MFSMSSTTSRASGLPISGSPRIGRRQPHQLCGVKAIAEEIDVRLPSDTKRADDEIAARAVDILKWQVGLSAASLTVKVEKGIVTLTGDVDWQYQKTDAEHVVHKLSGG